MKTLTSISNKAVSIHASSREDATSTTSITFIKFLFQSTRPRGRTRQSTPGPFCGQGVSIHASSREDATAVSIHASSREDATLPIRRWNGIPYVSIHASSREDATHVKQSVNRFCCFNPRVLAGGRDAIQVVLVLFMLCFNPRVLAGGRDSQKACMSWTLLFQSTRPRGRTRRCHV